MPKSAQSDARFGHFVDSAAHKEPADEAGSRVN
jgi:hypothetical protein